MGFRLNDQLEFQEANIEPSWSRVLNDSYDLSDTMTGYIDKYNERKSFADVGDMLSPERANEMYPGLNADREISSGEAEYIYGERKRKQKLQETIDSSTSFLKNTVAPFATGVAKSFTDPLEIGVNLMTGFGVGAIGKQISKQVGSSLVKSVATNKIVQGATDAAISTIIAEAPNIRNRNESFEEYTSEELLYTLTASAVMQVGIGHAGVASQKIADVSKSAGAKTMGKMFQFAENLENKGIASGKYLNKLHGILEEKFTKTPQLKETIAGNDVLAKNVEVADGDGFRDIVNKVLDKHREGKIGVEDLQFFKDTAIAKGVDERALTSIANDTEFKFNDDEIKSISDDLRADMENPNPQIRELDEQLSKTDPDTIVREDLNYIDRLQEQGELPDEVVRIKQELDSFTQEADFFDEFVKCRGF